MFDRSRRFASAAFLLPLFLLAGIAAAPATANRAETVELSFDAKTLDKAIADATHFLVQACGEDGEFVYRINLNPEITPGEKYNVLHHAGTLYSLTQAYERKADERVAAVVKRAAEFLKREVIGPVPDQEEMLAAWSRDAVNHAGAPDVAKLGGTGLTLAALVSVERIAPGTTKLEDLRKLGRFVRYMQKEDGSFYSRFFLPPAGRDDSWRSLYYPGEAALGMVMLYEQDPNPDWLESAVDALSYLSRSRESVSDVPPDHWALIATSRLLALKDIGWVDVDRELLTEHGRKIAENIVRSLPSPRSQLLLGSHANDGSTTPTATRLKGLIAALDFLPGERGALRRRTMNTLDSGIAFLLLAQVDDGVHRGAMPRAIRTLPVVQGRNDLRSFNRLATEVRIDYVQHALSAYIGYEALAFPQSSKSTQE